MTRSPLSSLRTGERGCTLSGMATSASSFLSVPNPTPKPYLRAKKFRIWFSTPFLLDNPLLALFPAPIRLRSQRYDPLLPCSAVRDVEVEQNQVKEVDEGDGEALVEEGKKRKLYVVGLPWNCSATDIANLFGECGVVKDVEIIKDDNGKNLGFAFVTMSSGEEARAAIEKFNAYELMGRIIRVEFSKRYRKPATPPFPKPVATKGETRYKVFAGNLDWRVRSINLKNFFSKKFNPLAARVIFDSPSGKSAGYGFVSFATMEEAEVALKELDGKELMGRPLRLRTGRKKGKDTESEPEEAEDNKEPPGEA